ncbi:hypothetical protein [Streptomyces sp. C10-9-1]|uniref:hypothetical protein n=1 Tax=Streptomyces sp. C10-9-1 TaxID=1859285 RepID=UPI003F4A1242
MTQPPEATVEAVRYAVSVLPADDINFNAYALYVQRRRDGWGITDGAGWVETRTGTWTLDHYEALTFPTPEPALALAQRFALRRTVNGISVTEAYQRTHPATTTPPRHRPAGTNAEQCPACHGTNPDWPFLCPGPPAAPAAPEEPQ